MADQHPPFDLRVDFDADRIGSVDLASATVVDDIYVFLQGDPAGVQQVEFRIDGRSVGSDRSAPWDLVGGNDTRARPFDTNTLSDGAHTITAVVSFNDGRTATVTDEFAADNVPDTAATFDLRVSTTADRAASEDLQSATLRGNHVIFLEGDPAGVERVEFAVDGRVVRTDWAAPWTFGGGFLNANRVEPFDSRTVGNGEHSISAVATLADGSTVTVTDTFQVANDAPLL